jgi:outer membrane receptor protein involved in Fe transport
MIGTALAALAAGLVPASADGTLETVIVTGTHIQRPNLQAISPVTTVSSDDIKLQGVTTIEDSLNQLPQFTADANEHMSGGSDGTANVNLRGLGSGRNLVLIDGQRFLPTLAIDTNFIPTTMIERVDVLTGGASAVYGSDAISGVVNFIINKHLNGLRVSADWSIAQHTNDDDEIRKLMNDRGFTPAPSLRFDGMKYNIGVAVGSDLANGKGNVSAYFGYRSVNPVTQDMRDYSSCPLWDYGTTFYCGGSGNHAYGRFNPLDGPSAGLDLANAKDGTKAFVTNDASFQYNYSPLNYIQRQDRRMTAGAFANYNITEKIEAYASFMYMNDASYSQEAPGAIWLGTNYAINCDNPLMSNAQKTKLCGSTTSTADVHTLVGYRMANGAGRRNDMRHQDYRGALGFRGNINDHITFDVSAIQSQMTNHSNYQNDVDQIKAGRGMQVVLVSGVATCKSVVDGSDPNCVPVDVFSAKGPSAAGYGYIFSNAFTSAEQSLTQYSGLVSADLGAYGLVSPWASEGIAAVVGFEHRAETLKVKYDTIGKQNGSKDADGKVANNEFFSELSVPLVQNRPGIKSLGLTFGYRYSIMDASSSARTAPTKYMTTYKVQADYAPSDDIRFRAGFNRAVRAPNISELFGPVGLGNVTGRDLCAGATPSKSLAQCQLSGVTAAEYGHIVECPADICVMQSGGNEALKPEVAETLTVGFVATPTMIDNLSLSLDYYNIQVGKYIDTVAAETIMAQCFDQANPLFCGMFHRDHTAGGILFGPKGYVDSRMTNIGYLHASGLDFGANYHHSVGEFGRLEYNFVGTMVLSKVKQNVTGVTTPFDCTGLFGPSCGQSVPGWRHNLRTTWTLPETPLSLSINWRYFGGVSLSSNRDLNLFGGSTSTLNAKIPDYNWFDLAGTYDFNDNLRLTAGVNNIMDRSAPTVAAGSLYAWGNGNTYPGVYDPMGRTLFVNLTAKY